MSGVDTSIYGNLLRPPKTVAEYQAEADQREQNQLGLQSARMNLLSAQRSQQDEDALRQLYQQPDFNPQSDAGISAIARISPKAAAAAQSALLTTKKTQAEIDKEQTATAGLKLDQQIKRRQDHVSQLAGVSDVPGAVQWINDAVKSGELPMQQAVQVIQGLQGGQIPLQEWRSKAMMGGLSALDQIREQRQLAELEQTKARDAATAKHQQNQDNTASGNLKVSQDRLAYDKEQPKGVVVQGDSGPLMVDPRTGDGMPVTVGGKPVGPKLVSVPAAAQTAIITNSQNLQKVQQAIDLLDGKKVGALEGDKGATGFKGYLPNGLLNRVDPKGVDTRAMISDIGSLVIHDRSGANVTASESPRLMPFIPLATDDAETARKKLVRFKQVYEQEANALSSAYGPDAGYRGRGGGASGSFDAADIHSQADAILRRDK